MDPTLEYHKALNALFYAFDSLRRAAQALPAAPESGVCSCGNAQYNIEERGYTRWSETEFVDGVWCAYTDGWDDMSEDASGPEVLICRHCEAIYRVPDVSWD